MHEHRPYDMEDVTAGVLIGVALSGIPATGGQSGYSIGWSVILLLACVSPLLAIAAALLWHACLFVWFIVRCLLAPSAPARPRPRSRLSMALNGWLARRAARRAALRRSGHVGFIRKTFRFVRLAYGTRQAALCMAFALSLFIVHFAAKNWDDRGPAPTMQQHQLSSSPKWVARWKVDETAFKNGRFLMVPAE
jgi:hypothetical protein